MMRLQQMSQLRDFDKLCMPWWYANIISKKKIFVEIKTLCFWPKSALAPPGFFRFASSPFPIGEQGPIMD